MNSSANTIRNLVIHRLIKAAHGAAQLELRDRATVANAAAQRLIDHLCTLYAERLGKGYGRFEDDEDNFPLPRFLRQHVVEQSIDFPTFAALALQHLLSRIEQEELASGGLVLIARVEHGQADYLFVAMVNEQVGTAVTSELELVDSVHLDVANLRVAGRIDLQGWQQRAERYLSFLKGRGDVAQYFKLFLACNTVVTGLRETQKLVRGLEKFAADQRLESNAREQLFERAYGHLDEAGEDGLPLSLDSLIAQAWPEAPGLLRESLHDESLELGEGYVPDRRAIKPLVRFKAAAAQWKLEFDRKSLQSGAVIYDKQHDRLILSDLPEGLRRELGGE